MGVKGATFGRSGPFRGVREFHGPSGDEYMHDPSPLARRVWLYVRAVGRAHPPATFRHAQGGHDGFLLHYLTRGQLWHRIRNQLHTIGPGEACLFDVAAEITYGDAGPGQLEFDWVWFNGKDLPLLFQELRADDNPVFSRLAAERMESLFGELLDITRTRPVTYEPRASALLTELLGELFAARAPLPVWTAISQPRPLSDPVRRALDYMTRYYEHGLTGKQIAMKAGQGLSAFTRTFHREMGLPPVAYLNQFRIEQAKEHLVASTRSIAEIARTVGFPNQNYFARRFTQIVGMSPREYRRVQQKRR